jgi:allantoin racemase
MVVSAEAITGRRLLVINPNTNPDVTAKVRQAVEACLPSPDRADVVNPPSGPFAIETSADRAAAVPHVLALIAERGSSYDGYVLACFDDIAIAEAGRLVAAPVISMAEAGIRAAALSHRQFAVVTTVEAAVPTIAGLAETYDVGDRCLVVATGIGVTETAARTETAEAALAAAVADAQSRGATTIILGSGAYAGRRAELTARFGLPFIDGLEAAVVHCCSAAQSA